MNGRTQLAMGLAPFVGRYYSNEYIRSQILKQTTRGTGGGRREDLRGGDEFSIPDTVGDGPQCPARTG